MRDVEKNGKQFHLVPFDTYYLFCYDLILYGVCHTLSREYPGSIYGISHRIFAEQSINLYSIVSF